jgi:hypothetical protein
MTGPHAPAIALANPGVRDPMMAGPPGGPTSGDPFVPSADPIPIAIDPHVARRRSDANDFHPRRRRRHHDHAVRVVTLIGDHDATWQRYAAEEAECQKRLCPRLIHDRYHQVPER